MSRKLLKIKILTSLFLSLAFATVSINAQSDGDKKIAFPGVRTAEPFWEKYNLNMPGLAVSFPKIPVVLETSDPCDSFKRSTFYAYAGEVVYTAVVTSRYDPPKDRKCDRIIPFGERTWERRIGEFSHIVDATELRAAKESSSEQINFTGEKNYIRLVKDLKNDRIIDLRITHHKELITDHSRFFDSLEINFKGQAVPVKDGAERMIGDLEQKTFADRFWKENKVEELTFPLYVVHMPKPGYTDEARYNSTQGTVKLRVTFYASGSVGNIHVIEGLPHGLTQRAIDVAKKIAFIPKKENGLNKSISRPIHYSFTIY
ncbi:MAG: TonB family protein [Acidobacteria bacterium]|nr:TonB family protein [Acidobacteriota bacterium]